MTPHGFRNRRGHQNFKKKKNDVSVAHGRNGVHQVEYQTFAARSPVVARGEIGQTAARVVSDGIASDRSIAIGKM